MVALAAELPADDPTYRFVSMALVQLQMKLRQAGAGRASSGAEMAVDAEGSSETSSS